MPWHMMDLDRRPDLALGEGRRVGDPDLPVWRVVVVR